MLTDHIAKYEKHNSFMFISQTFDSKLYPHMEKNQD